MTSHAEIAQRVSELARDLDEEELGFALVTLAQRHGHDAPRLLVLLATSWPAPEAELLDAAAQLAARHEALNGGAARVRSLLELLAQQHVLARQLGGDPRHVLDEAERVLLLQAQVEGEALRSIWDEPMIEARDAAAALGAAPSNRERVRRYRERSWLLGLPSGRGYLYPTFQFAVERRDVAPAVRAVNEQLDAAGDPWGVASWWVALNDRLGARPRDLVGTERADDLAGAAASLTQPLG